MVEGESKKEGGGREGGMGMGMGMGDEGGR